MNRWRTQERPMVIAHRGHNVGAPEQTLAAYAAAATLGADMIEADVHRSSDGRLVMLHDATVDRTTNGHGRVSDFTFAELRALDAGSWFSPDFAGERVPSLDELFDLAEERGLALCVEAKGATPHEHAFIAQLIAEQIAERGRLDRDVLASFDHDALLAAAIAVPGLALAPDRLPERGPSSPSVIIAQARRIGAEVIQYHHLDLSAEIVNALHAADIAVWAWPPTTPDEVEEAYAIGVDGLMGDDVAVIVAALRARPSGAIDGTSAAQSGVGRAGLAGGAPA